MRGECVFHEEVLVPIARGGRVEDAWWNYSYSPLFDDSGATGGVLPDSAIAGVLVIVHEVTAQVAARKQLETLAVQQAAGRRQADAMRQQAEAASRAKDEFLATVSHELRTPLNAILGWARILMQPGARGRVDKGLAIIERNAQAQAKIIDDILDVSRIISGKLRLSVRAVDVASVIDATVDSIRPAAAAKGVALDVDIVLEPFTPPGGRVSVWARQQRDELRLVVRDTGAGISPKFLPFVFDRFRQADASTSKQHAGLGLGLAIVRHLIELHGGTVRAESQGEGRGATFEVVLPRGHVVQADDRGVAGSTPQAGGHDLPSVAGALSGVEVLVLDDQPDARELTAVVLEDAGAKVSQAESASTALSILDKTNIDAIVSDIAMPYQDGYAFIEQVRRMHRTQKVPALALTAFARPEDRERALAGGFQQHLPKPIDPARLVATIVAMLRR
jgi:signal transduction histidine kinase/CheY-like chemotaxis protein